MLPQKRTIDHLVYIVPDLDQAINDFEQLLGIRPTFGGCHQTKGTKNALVHLGNEAYLEILAADLENTAITPPRWMGIDLIKTPTLSRWAICSEALQQDQAILQSYHPEMGVIEQGARKTTNGDILKWDMILPLAQPLIDIMPFMVDWSQSEVHPTGSLPEACTLLALEVTHPNPAEIQPFFRSLELDLKINPGEQAQISAQIQCPNGVVKL